MRARAFTLMELMVVIVMVSLLAAIVSPGLGAIRGTQQDAGTVEVRRMLRTAQQIARASGRPHGLWVDAAGDRVRLVRLSDAGVVVPALDALGGDSPMRSMNMDFAGLQLAAADPGDGHAVAETVLWFDFLGHPETRDADGSTAQPAGSNPEITFVAYDPIEVDRVTGALR